MERCETVTVPMERSHEERITGAEERLNETDDRQGRMWNHVVRLSRIVGVRVPEDVF